MTGRIDHAALASQTIKNMREEEKSGGQSEVLAMAQVHATLALVEQQRIANIIAWTTANGSEPLDHVVPEIEKGLGLV